MKAQNLMGQKKDEIRYHVWIFIFLFLIRNEVVSYVKNLELSEENRTLIFDFES